MSDTIDINGEVLLPALPLRGIVAFPGVQTSIEIVRGISLKAFTAAATVHDAKIILVAQKDLTVEEPTDKDLYRVGTLAKIVHVVKNPQGNLSVIFEGIARVKIDSFDFESGFILNLFDTSAQASHFVFQVLHFEWQFTTKSLDLVDFRQHGLQLIQRLQLVLYRQFNWIFLCFFSHSFLQVFYGIGVYPGHLHFAVRTRLPSD